MPASAIPYCGSAPLPSEWLTQWNFDPWLLAALLAASVWAIQTGAQSPIWLALAGLFVLFVSPLCGLSSALFAARVGHHVVLTALIAPLVAWAMPRRPGGAWVWAAAHAMVFWLWHAPAPYAAALSRDLLFWVMQLSLLGTAIALWAAILRAPAPTALAVLLATSVQMGLLGALLTFGQTPFYMPHLASTQPWGLSPLEDQQLAGLLMWVGGAAIYLAAALAIGWRWLGPARPRAAA